MPTILPIPSIALNSGKLVIYLTLGFLEYFARDALSRGKQIIELLAYESSLEAIFAYIL